MIRLACNIILVLPLQLAALDPTGPGKKEGTKTKKCLNKNTYLMLVEKVCRKELTALYTNFSFNTRFYRPAAVVVDFSQTSKLLESCPLILKRVQTK